MTGPAYTSGHVVEILLVKRKLEHAVAALFISICPPLVPCHSDVTLLVGGTDKFVLVRLCNNLRDSHRQLWLGGFKILYLLGRT